jgi:enoyl-CoA hydratase/carnithine racemase
MTLELGRLLRETAADPSLRVLILTGAGRAFSGGHDLRQPPASGESRVSDARQWLWALQALTSGIVEHPAVVIAAMNGIAVGMAAELCTAADLRIASENAELMFPEVHRAMFVTNGVLHLLPRAVGQAHAADWLLSGRRVPANELLAAGFVSRVVPHGEFDAAVMALANQIASHAPRSVRRVKQLLHRSWQTDLRGMFLEEVDAVMETMTGSDLTEGTLAFLEKREPRYTGK